MNSTISEQHHRIREGEKGLGAVQSGVGPARIFARMFLALCSRFGPHGMPFEAGPLSPSHAGGERKRKSCGATSDTKVPTRGFSAKKEVVWRDLLSAKNITKCH